MPFLKIKSKKVVAPLLICIYRLFLSPLLHTLFGPSYGCRFVPTCSQYAEEVIQTHGWLRGVFFTMRRLLRCHPFAQTSYDPVPHGICPHSIQAHHFTSGR